MNMHVIIIWSFFQAVIFHMHCTITMGQNGQSLPTVGPLTFREKVARYRLLKGARLIQPSIPNVDKEQYLEYLKEGTIVDAQTDFLSANPSNVTVSKERLTLEGVVGDHVWLVLSKFGRYQVPALTIYTSLINRQGRPTVVAEVINYAVMETSENDEQ